MLALLRGQSLILDKTHSLTEATVVPENVHLARIKVEAPCVLRIIGCGRPIAAVVAHVEDISIATAVARSGQNNGIAILTCHLITAIILPFPCTIVFQFFTLLFSWQLVAKSANRLIKSVINILIPTCFVG